MLISVVSAKGAPGVTAAALALARVWPRPVLLADLDARGGDVIWAFGRGQVTDGRGLLGLQVTSRREPWVTALWSHVVEMGESKWLLPGLHDPRHAGTMQWPGLAAALCAFRELDVIADCGSVRSVDAPSPVWTSSDLVVVALRPTLPGIHNARAAAAVLRADLMTRGTGTDRLGSIIIGPGRPYPTGEVVESMAQAAPVLGELAWDPEAALVLGGQKPAGRRFGSSSLMRSAQRLADVLGGRALELQAPVSAMTLESGGPLPVWQATGSQSGGLR